MSTLNNIKIGADPEFFMINKEGKFISAIDRIGGSKSDPRPIDDRGFAVQEDNVAVEFNIPAATSKQEFINSIEFALSYLNEELKKMELTIAALPSAFFPPEELANPKAFEFGCEPDLNVWTKTVNPRPVLPEDQLNLRSAGGHIHVGYDDPQEEVNEQIIKSMDIFVGVPALQFDKDSLRRKLYGKAGCFRFKPYGVEYRTLSNFWLQSPDYVNFVYDQTMKAIDFVKNNGEIHPDTMLHVCNAINKGNEKSAEWVMKKYGC